MKINFTVKEKPFKVVFDMYGNSNDFISNVKESKEIDVIVNKKTKTSIETLLRKDSNIFGYYKIPLAISGLSFLTREEGDILHPYRKYAKAYFKVAKKQGFEQYKAYLRAIFQDMFYDIPELTVNVMIDRETKEMLKIEEKMIS